MARSTANDLLPQIRALTSRRYGRLLNRTITGRVLEWLERAPSWRLPLADGPDGRQVPSGAYLSDRDMFLLLVDADRRIDDPSDPSGQGLARGFMLRNSEVGAASLTVDAFLYRYVCGNRLIVGFQHLVGLRLRHVGTRPESWADIFPTLSGWLESDTTQESLLLSRAARQELGGTRDAVVSALVQQGFTRRQGANAYTLAERHETHTNPRSIWGLVQGATRLAQQVSHQDARYELDRLAAGLLRAAA